MKKKNKNTYNLKNNLKKYLFFIITLVFLGVLFAFDFTKGLKASDIIIYSFKEILLVLPPIFILIGLLDVWIPKESMMKHLGEESGLKGIILSFLLGIFAAGPLYAAFPIAAVFMKKQVKFFNIIIFIGAWSTTKIPMFLFEISSMGYKFALLRLVLNIFVIVAIAYLVGILVNKDDIDLIYKKAENL
jgi:uncharacterized membrane protein YraQ (UPF0718 family)